MQVGDRVEVLGYPGIATIISPYKKVSGQNVWMVDKLGSYTNYLVFESQLTVVNDEADYKDDFARD